MNSSSLRRGRFALKAVAAAAAFCIALPSVYAVGLGRLVVHSALGETLRAEIDVTSLSPEEGANLRVNVAPPESYRAAGMDYNSVLPGAHVLLQVRDGRTYLQLTSDRAVLEPFVDVILELEWNTGRLVREYTLLLDPPPTLAKSPPQAPALPVAVPAAVTAAAPSATPQVAATAPTAIAERKVAQTKAEAASAPTPAQPSVASKTTPVAAPSADSYRVRYGDTLSHIAGRWARPGMSLDQMLVSMFRANPDAFIRKNMNRLKTGVVLSVPNTETVGAIPQAEARRTVLAQSADFGKYRQRLASAAAVAKTDDAGRLAKGKVEAEVDDRDQLATTPTPDKLKLSKAADGLAASAAEDRLSREREAHAAAARAHELKKNVEELRRLSSVASAAASSTAESTTALPSLQATASSAVASTPSVLVEAPILGVLPDSRPAASGVASAAVAAAEASSEVPVPPPATPVRTAADESGSLLGDNALPLGLGGLVLVGLLAGYGALRYSRRPKTQSGVTAFLESRLQPDSFFGASGGQRIDTRDTTGASSSMAYSLSQIDAIGDVDPVAEADVYLAYGRDLQAEEILKEAMRSTPERMAIRLKLLEVYAKRRDTKGFELLAVQVFGVTGGAGEDWAKAQEFGAQIDPDNQLYKPGGRPEAIGDTEDYPDEPLGASTAPQSVLPSPSKFARAQAEQHSSDSAEGGVDFDLDLNLDQQTTRAIAKAPVQESTQPMPFFATSEPEKMDFELPLEAPSEPFSSDASAPLEAPAVDLGSSSKMSLDFETPTMSEASARGGSSDAGDDDGVNPLQRKLNLAEEFRQIGDFEGARDLLQEVIDQSDGALKTKAKNMLGEIN